MAQPQAHGIESARLAAERARLVRLCARLTGDATSAEDLAQETLFEAWRHADSLRDPAARQAWLSGIARNVCRRWARARGREPAYAPSGAAGLPAACDGLADDLDLELELERHELATLLDRALALLPVETRLALIQAYVADAPRALVAERLGLSEGAVAMRLARGKLALRRILAHELRDEALAFGLHAPTTDPWRATRVWCSMCGVERLEGSFDPGEGTLLLRCPGCFPAYGLYQARSERQPGLFAGVRGVTAAYRRLLADCDAYFASALVENAADCPDCGAPATFHRHLPASELPRRRESRGVHVRCAACRQVFHVSLGGLVLALPEGRAFWRAHGRIRAHPEREVEVEGRPAVVSRLESVGGAARLEVVTDAERLTTLRIYADGVRLPPA